MYSTVDEVMGEASLSSNQFILDTEIKAKITSADALINGYLFGKYSVPFADGSVPPLITYVSTMIAAGMILKKDYGPMAPGDAKDGAEKIKSGMDILNKLQDGDIVLVDAAGASLLASDNKVVSFFPTDASSTMTDGGASGVGPGYYGQDAAVVQVGNGPYITIERKF